MGYGNKLMLRRTPYWSSLNQTIITDMELTTETDQMIEQQFAPTLWAQVDQGITSGRFEIIHPDHWHKLRSGCIDPNNDRLPVEEKGYPRQWVKWELGK